MQVKKLDTERLNILPNIWVVARINPGQPQSNGSYQLLSKQESADLQASWGSSFKAAILNNTKIEVQDDTPANRSLAYTIVSAGSTPPPKPLLSLYQKRVPHPNYNFFRRQAEGEIVVSPFSRGAIRVVSEPATFEKPGNWAESATFVMEAFLPGLPGFRGTRFYITDRLFLLSSSHRFSTGQYRLQERGYLPPLHVEAKEVYDMMIKSHIDTGLVARTLADINKGTMDILTALAETPLLIQSILDGMKLLASMLKAAKRREIDLSAAHERVRLGNKRAFDKAVDRLNDRKSKRKPGQKVLSGPSYARLRQREVDRFNRANKRALIEFTDAVASVWLNFRYNISPTVYMINDLEDTLAFKRTYLTRRNGYQKDYPLILAGSTHYYNCNHRIFIKRKIQSTGSLNSVSANFAVTAWELVPLSFVIDWFVNIGDIISAFSVASSFSEQGATWAERSIIDSDITNSDGQRVSISGYVYNRIVIDPIQLTCLDFKWDMNASRYADSLALSWNGIRSQLINALGHNKPSGRR